MDLNTLFFMRPSLHGMVYPAFSPRDYLLLRGKLPISPPPVPLGHHALPQHHHHQQPPVSPPRDLSPRKRPISLSSSTPHPHPQQQQQQQQDPHGPIKHLADVQPPRNPNKPLTSFSIADILESSASPPKRPRVVRP